MTEPSKPSSQPSETSTQGPPNYKKTLNLPKTAFPMRAGLAQNEPTSQKRWAKDDLYRSIVEQRSAAGAEAFRFHDGPPYANGSLHLGHLLNRCLKDMVVRAQLMEGRWCPFVPGWDCHGLPIEHKVVQQMHEDGTLDGLREQPEDQQRLAIRKACKKHASKHIKLQSKQMQRMLTLADYDDPYLTMVPAYERDVLEVFAALVEQGLVYRDLKAVHWSIANETALADAELEYQEKEDVSVYVDFEAADAEAVGRAFGIELDQTPCFMIWTTTPWTLPANLAIAVHERFTYVLARVDGNLTILAGELLEKVAALAGAESVDRLAEAPGSSLVGLEYRHPFCDRRGRVVAADYVTLEDGTGLVHTAPGHGAEDYQTGLREGLEIYSPVLEDGTYDDTVPEWLRGRLIWDANGEIVEHLRRSGHLFHDHRFTHSYPHDWRSKTPVIFRATEQWFVGVDRPSGHEAKSLRELALGATATNVRFLPEWGRNRMRGMLESRPDWCLSRQRSWGLPIPAFRTADGTVVLTPATVRAVAAVFGERGSDAWFTESPSTLLAGWDAAGDPDLPEGLDAASLGSGSLDATFEKMHDIFDVWFESGSSWNAVMRSRDLGYPADLYLEGSDQHRGWFQLSLLPALGVTGTAPYRTVLTHGFMVDKDGRKLSKSAGNALGVDELLENFGADVCRWWVSSLAIENDIKVDLSFFELAGDSYRKIRNTLRFLLSNLDDFAPCTTSNPNGRCVDLASLSGTSIDLWVLHETRRLRDSVRAALLGYELRKAHQQLYDFCNETLSAFYCAAVKDRLYCDAPDAPRRRATQTAMWDVLEVLCRLLAPLIPHTADEAYRGLWAPHDDEDAKADRCIHRRTHQDVDFDGLAPLDEGWPAVLEARNRALKALEEAKVRGIENPLDAGVAFPDPGGVLARFAADLPDLLGVSRVRFTEGGAIEIDDLRGEPRCDRSWKRDGTVRQRSDGGMLTDRDADAVGVS